MELDVEIIGHTQPGCVHKLYLTKIHWSRICVKYIITRTFSMPHQGESKHFTGTTTMKLDSKANRRGPSAIAVSSSNMCSVEEASGSARGSAMEALGLSML